MTEENNLMITILTNRNIPFLNVRGPISTPIAVSQIIVDNLKKLGFEVNIHTKDAVSTSRQGLRTLRTDFVSREVVEEIKEALVVDVPPVISPNPEVVITAPITEETPLPVVEETTVAKTLDDKDEPTEENKEEADELVVYELSHYNGWSKKTLNTYLTKAIDRLPAEVAETIDSLTKPELLKVIEKFIIPLAE
jgi:hypothetical protein